MKPTTACLAILLLLAACAPVKPAPSRTDPSGKWAGDYGSSPSRRDDVALELKYDNGSLTGVVRAGTRSLPLTRTSFKPDTGDISMEFDAQNNGQTVHYTIEGKLDGNAMTGSWTHNAQRGDFHVTRQ